MTTAEDKLDRLDQRLTELVVTLTAIGGDVRTVLSRLDQHDTDRADHEQRIRALEAMSRADHDARIKALEETTRALPELAKGLADLTKQVRDLERFRWLLTGAALVAGWLGGSASHYLLATGHG